HTGVVSQQIVSRIWRRMGARTPTTPHSLKAMRVFDIIRIWRYAPSLASTAEICRSVHFRWTDSGALSENIVEGPRCGNERPGTNARTSWTKSARGSAMHISEGIVEGGPGIHL